MAEGDTPDNGVGELQGAPRLRVPRPVTETLHLDVLGVRTEYAVEA